MTAPTYDTLTTDDTGADKILTTGTVTALDQNPVSIAQRGTSAPRVQVPVREYKTSGTAATWTIPAGVTAFTIYVIGGGGGTGGTPADSTVTYNSITYTGSAGSNATTDTGGAGGSASGGDLNLAGQRGSPGVAIATESGSGGIAAMFGGYSYGNGSTGAAGDGGGGAGGCCVKRIDVVVGQTSATYTVGAGGTGAGGGLIVFEY